jgi:hypothetical protein
MIFMILRNVLIKKKEAILIKTALIFLKIMIIIENKVQIIQ